MTPRTRRDRANLRAVMHAILFVMLTLILVYACMLGAS